MKFVLKKNTGFSFCTSIYWKEKESMFIIINYYYYQLAKFLTSQQ